MTLTIPKPGQEPSVAQGVRVSRPSDHVLLITIDRPAVRNAMDAATGALIHAVVTAMESDGSLLVGVLTGTGTTFCAGADLREMRAGRDVRIPRPGGFGGFVETPRTKPWIAALNGPAWGGGTELTIACDMCVAAETATLALSEVRLGLAALSGGVVGLPRRIGRNIAIEAVLTGEPITAARAHELGLVNHVVPADQVLERALRLAQTIARNSPHAVKLSLHLARASGFATEEEVMKMNVDARDILMQSPDFAEGPRAFLEKRPPQWVRD